LIGGDQKFVHSAFTLEANNQWPSKLDAYMAALFGSFGAKSLSNGGKLMHNIYRTPNSSQVDKLFFLKSYKVYN
jgi:hypothetical protein